jgi:hypothetical protein
MFHHRIQASSLRVLLPLLLLLDRVLHLIKASAPI